MLTAVIIPARYASTRLPGKPLIKIQGKSIIQWVYEKSQQAKTADKIIVATDHQKIFDEVKKFGGEVQMTSPDHKSGSDRIAEVARNNPDIKIAVNVQGDEPLINPESIDMAVHKLLSDEKADISTLIREITEEKEVSNPNLVKAVIANSGRALYFSRAAIPYQREQRISCYYAHIGLYVFRRESLIKMTELPQTELEQAECLEQLRALQNNLIIQTQKVDYKPLGIDTPEDLEEFRRIIEQKI